MLVVWLTLGCWGYGIECRFEKPEWRFHFWQFLVYGPVWFLLASTTNRSLRVRFRAPKPEPVPEPPVEDCYIAGQWRDTVPDAPAPELFETVADHVRYCQQIEQAVINKQETRWTWYAGEVPARGNLRPLSHDAVETVRRMMGVKN